MSEPAADNLESPLSDLYQISRVIAETASDAIITIDENSTIFLLTAPPSKSLDIPKPNSWVNP